MKNSYLEEIKRQGRDANPFFSFMGIELGLVGEGEATLLMEIRPDMLNGAGWLQGGVFTAICDEAMALALFTILNDGEQIATISESTSFLLGAKNGKVVASGKVVKKGRQIAFTEGHVVRSEDGSQLSKTSASFAIIR